MRVDPLQILTKLAAVQNIPTRRVTPPLRGWKSLTTPAAIAGPPVRLAGVRQLLLDSTPENTLLLVEDTFELYFALFRIPDEKNTVFLIGPWTVGPRTPSARKWVRRYLGEAGEAAVQEYYNGVKILEASDFYGALRVVVDTMFGCTVPVQELKEFLPFQFHPDTRYFHEPEFQKEIPVTMLEQRYESENRILDAVARGDEEAAIEAMHQHSRFTYGGRFEGTLYQQKNKMIVLNTLLRKAIEPSKVHPYYIDAISSKYSRIIEEANEVPNEMMWQMTRDYCAYVRRYSLKEYSPAVQKVMNYVNLNVAEPLTLKSLAAMCFISIVPVGIVQAGDRQHSDRLYQHPARQPRGPAAGAEQPHHCRRGRGSGHSGRELFYKDLQKDAGSHPHTLPPRTQRKVKNEKNARFFPEMYVLCKTSGKRRAFSVRRNLLHEQNDVVTILKGFMDFWHGIWMYVAFLTDFVLDIKKNVVHNNINCEECTKKRPESCELVPLRTFFQMAIIQTETMERTCKYIP